jgi:hypothetical protein
MPLESEIDIIDENIKEIYVFEADKPQDKRLAYRINKAKKVIKMYLEKQSFIKEITILGFKTLPEGFSEYGYIPGLMYYLNKKLSEKNVTRFTISKDGKSSIRKTGNTYKIVFNFDEFLQFKKQMTEINNESKRDRSQLADDFFGNLFPKAYEPSDISLRNRLKKVVRNLGEDLIDYFGAPG